LELKRKTVEGALESSAYATNFIAAWREAVGRTEEASGAGDRAFMQAEKGPKQPAQHARRAGCILRTLISRFYTISTSQNKSDKIQYTRGEAREETIIIQINC
jgi:hypothetical protein